MKGRSVSVLLLALCVLVGGFILLWREQDITGVAMAVTASLCVFAVAVLGWRVVCRWRPLAGLGRLLAGLTVGLALASALGTWYGYFLEGHLVTWEYRAGVGTLMVGVGVAMLALVGWPAGMDQPLEHSGLRLRDWCTGRTVGVMAVVVAAGSAGIGWLILDAMPHMSDALTYLIQGRVLMDGRLALDPPMHPELFRHSLFFVEGEQAYYGKYPVGWPAVLGLFDAVGVAILAAPVMAGVTIWATFLLLRPHTGGRMAALTALLLAVTPWLWFNAATFMAHVASMCWLMLFLLGFDRAWSNRSITAGLLGGVALGAAVLTRPQDASFFALPCIAVAGWLVLRQPRRWLGPMGAVAVGAIPAVLGYFAINRHLTGEGGQTGYGDTPIGEIASQAPQSLVQWLSWLHENWVGLSREWLAGAAPVGVGLVVGLVFGWRYARSHKLLLACALSFFLGYSLFIFQSRPWVGPRWLVPLLPAGAFILACGLRAAWAAWQSRDRHAALGLGWLRIAATAVVLTWLVVVPLKLAELRLHPPHGVDARVVRAAEAAGLNGAVVGLPTEPFEAGTEADFTYKDPRAGMWRMRVPFEESPIIYVRRIDGWQQKAREAWPGRRLYTIDPEPAVFRVHPVNGEQKDR